MAYNEYSVKVFQEIREKNKSNKVLSVRRFVIVFPGIYQILGVNYFRRKKTIYNYYSFLWVKIRGTVIFNVQHTFNQRIKEFNL